MTWLLNLFRCQHLRTTLPLTPKGRRCYVACLSCGKEFAYDWATMRVGAQVKAQYAGREAERVVEALVASAEVE